MGTGIDTALRAPRSGVTLTELGKLIIRAAQLGVRTLIPCQVTLVNPDGTVDVQLQQLMVLNNEAGEQVLPPVVVQLCQVAFQATSAGYLHFDIIVGTYGYILPSDRSLEKWLKAAIPVDPKVRSLHNIIDGVFHPQLRPTTAPLFPIPNPFAEPGVTTVHGSFVDIGAGPLPAEPAVLATKLIGLIDDALAAAIQNFAAMDGGVAAFTAFQTVWNTGVAVPPTPPPAPQTLGGKSQINAVIARLR